MKHPKEDYPYHFSLAMRMNPLDPDADPAVKEQQKQRLLRGLHDSQYKK